MADANEEKKTAPRKRRDIAKTDVVDDLGRQLPHNFDAEEGVLAAILIDVSKEVINACVAMKIREDYFFKPEHRLIYSSLIALYSEGKSIDEIVLAEYLKKRNVLEQVGGITAINNIAGRIETFTHYRQWLEILREKYFMREIIRVCAQTVDNAYGNRGDIATFIGDVEQKILAISQDRIGDSVKKASEQVPAAMILINKLISSKGELMGVPTGFTGLDNMMRGLHANEMIVIAGRPGTGKTSIALNIAESALFGREPIPTLIFSLEMLGEQLYSRMIASRARIDQHKLSIGRIGPDQLRDLNTTANELKSAPLWIDDTAGISILEMRAGAPLEPAAWRQARAGDCGLSSIAARVGSVASARTGSRRNFPRNEGDVEGIACACGGIGAVEPRQRKGSEKSAAERFARIGFHRTGRRRNFTLE